MLRSLLIRASRMHVRTIVTKKYSVFDQAAFHASASTLEHPATFALEHFRPASNLMSRMRELFEKIHGNARDFVDDASPKSDLASKEAIETIRNTYGPYFKEYARNMGRYTMVINRFYGTRNYHYFDRAVMTQGQQVTIALHTLEYWDVVDYDEQLLAETLNNPGSIKSPRILGIIKDGNLVVGQIVRPCYASFRLHDDPSSRTVGLQLAELKYSPAEITYAKIVDDCPEPSLLPTAFERKRFRRLVDEKLQAEEKDKQQRLQQEQKQEQQQQHKQPQQQEQLQEQKILPPDEHRALLARLQSLEEEQRLLMKDRVALEKAIKEGKRKLQQLVSQEEALKPQRATSRSRRR